MMKNIIILNLKNSITVCIVLLLLCSCVNSNKVDEQSIERMYYYIRHSYYGYDITGYEAQKIIETNDERKIIRYIYKVYPTIKNEIIIRNNYYKIKNDGLIMYYSMADTVGCNYLSVKKDTCIIWTHPDEDMNCIMQIEQCYIGEETVRIQNTKNINAHKFIAHIGSPECIVDGVTECYMYYDESFVLLKNEDINDGKSYIERIDSIPLEFGILLDSIAKVENEIK